MCECGLDAQVLSLPRYSKGSIGLVVASGDLLCGDLLENIKEPAINSIMDDSKIHKLISLASGTFRQVGVHSTLVGR